MSTRKKALAVAARFGFVLDAQCSGKTPDGGFSVIFDHPTRPIGADCRSITCANFTGSGGRKTAQVTWAEAIERMEAEGPDLGPECADPACDYHGDMA